MGSSCEIIGALGVINLGVVTVYGTLRGGTVTGTLVGVIICTYLGNTVVCVFSGCMVLNNFSNMLMMCYWLSQIVKGVCGPGFLITCISSFSALVACSVADNHGMTKCCGKNSTTSACISPLVLGV